MPEIQKIKNMINILPNTRIRTWGLDYGCRVDEKGVKISIMPLLMLWITQPRVFPDSYKVDKKTSSSYGLKIASHFLRSQLLKHLL